MQDWLIAERRRIIVQLQEGLSASGCVALLGEFHMGKTSTLHSLRYALTSPSVYISLANLKSTALIDSDEQFYEQTLRDLVEDWRGELPANVQLAPRKRKTAEERYDWFEDTLEQLARRPLTILIDDAERLLADYSAWGKNIFRRLPQLMTRTNNNIRVVLAGTPYLKQWAEELRHITGKAGLWDLIQRPLFLGPVSLQTVQDAFYENPSVARLLIKLCGGHPHCLWQLTKDLQLHTLPPNRLLNSIEEKAGILAEEWDKTFRCYWQTYDRLIRQICFQLTVRPNGLKTQTLRSKLDWASAQEVKQALAIMTKTGILCEDPESRLLRLIDLFQRWYKNETGFVEDVLVAQEPTPSKPSVSPKKTSTAPFPAAETTPSTELTFLLDQDLVFIRRNRFLSLGKLDIPRDYLSRDMRYDIEEVPRKSKQRFAENIKRLSRRLWMLLHNKPWFEEVIDSVDSRRHLRFNIPQEMNEFPFELLPLDDTGNKRIGTLVPISRQLIRQGRYVARAPLSLRPEREEPLRVLVVAAEVGGDVSIDADGQVYRGMDAQVVRGGESFSLGQLRLNKEVNALRQILSDPPHPVNQVTFLTHSRDIYDTEEHGVKIFRRPPTAEVFREILATSHEQFDILHFTGHALRVPSNPVEGGLLFEDRLVHLTELEGLLKGQEQLAFIYLSCCESGVLDIDRQTSDLLGLTHACIEAGVPAVLAMRWRIPVGVSLRLTQAFYPALFETKTLDNALCQAVQQLYQERDAAKNVYAAAPVLIMH